MLEVILPLKHGNILSEIAFVYASERSQKRSQGSPQPFKGIAMDFAKPIAIIIACIFFDAMIDGCMLIAVLLEALVPCGSIGIDRCSFGAALLKTGAKSLRCGIWTDRSADIAAFPPNGSLNRRSVCLISAMPFFLWHAGAAGHPLFDEDHPFHPH